METEGSEALLAALLGGRLPDANGRFGPFGGRFVPETLMPAIERLTYGVQHILPSAEFQRTLVGELKSWVGRPTALTHAPTLSKSWDADVWLKREDLAHTGAHKINNGIGQALLAKALGATRVVAETGAGQHGVASAAACARVGLPCTVYMGEIDVARQAPNVDRMRRFGATVVPVTSGDRTLRAAIDEAIRDWVSDPVGTYYLLGSAIGPHPYPYLVRELQAVIGREARAQIFEASGLPDAVVRVRRRRLECDRPVPWLPRRSRREALRSRGRRPRDLRSASIRPRCRTASPACLHGTHTMLLYDKHGQIQETHSISAGLDYPGVGPEHALLQSIGRVEYVTASDTETLAALEELCASEGILPALESSHALAGAKRWAAKHRGTRLLIGLSGRGDKDMPILAQYPMTDAGRDARDRASARSQHAAA